MEQRLIKVIAAALGVDASTLKLDTTTDDVAAWDSVAQVNIVSEIEAEFGVSIPIEKIAEIHRIREFLPYLANRPS
jgi:acyl carrier protein